MYGLKKKTKMKTHSCSFSPPCLDVFVIFQHGNAKGGVHPHPLLPIPSPSSKK